MGASKLCKKQVFDKSGWYSYQCSRKAKRDGYCTIHHPDYIAEKERQRNERWAREDAARDLRYAKAEVQRIINWLDEHDTDTVTRAELVAELERLETEQ